ncbi:SPOR domain-containing protein [Litorisediminicola beolgyonensis]|uniref:SPOR domain-containing protein n=1 Tax=Litorisediminicola beolgyonensis TaxID=1173614 RepID=A0ABW3ZJC3_9RHOB
MSSRITPTDRQTTARLRMVTCAAALMALAACGENAPGFLKGKDGGSSDTVSRAASSGAAAERDVEAPEVFQTAEPGLWDGRPSLGGVWVAHPDVSEPERVIIRNETNGQFVIGALFKRERETPGPRLQVSSDAAAAVGMLAGQPTQLNVVALRREEAPAADPATLAPVAETMSLEEELGAPGEIESAALDPVTAGAAAALSEAPAGIEAAEMPPAEPAPVQVAAAVPAPQPAPAPAVTSSLKKPFVQIGIFSVEQNARNTATAMRQAGMVPTVKEQSSAGKTFWRVLVGPATTKSEIDTLLSTIKGTGFTDAYAVTD